MDELIVSLCLILGWTFDEACKFVTEQPIKKVKLFVAELQYQKAVEDYRMAANFASIIATMASSKQRRYTVSEIIGHPPQRANTEDKIVKAAQKANIKLPSGGIK